MTPPKILFLTIGDLSWASSRLGAFWPAQMIPGAKAMQWKNGDDIPADYDLYVWTKVADVDAMRRLRQAGKKNVLIFCDPSWWWQPRETRAIADECDAVVAANEAGRDDFAEWYGTHKYYFVPDRLDLSHYPLQKDHAFADPVRFIWYGVSVNRISLFASLANLERLAANGVRVELTIYDNSPEQIMHITNMFQVYHTRWSLDRENQVIASHDIAMLPPYPGPWGEIKTNNKQLTAWACGLPTTTGEDYKEIFTLATSTEARKAIAALGMARLCSDFSIEKSAADWVRIAGEVCNA